MKNGGKRPGAGRKKGSQNKRTIVETEARQILVQRVLNNWIPILDMLMAIGMGKIKVRKDQKYPDPKVLQELVANVIGRPKQEFAGGMDMNMPQLEELSKNIKAILEKK